MLTLLETLQNRLDCLYLSDLHASGIRQRALQEALALSPDDFPLDQWQEAVQYLLGWTPSSSSVQELRALIAQCTSNA